jgi:hypothetical protein
MKNSYTVRIQNNDKVTYLQMIKGEEFVSIAGPRKSGLPVKLILSALISLTKKRIAKYFQFKNLTIQF